MLKFENAKRSFDFNARDGMNIELSHNTITTYNKSHENKIEDIIGRCQNLGVSMANGYLRITHEQSMELFKYVISNIVNHVMTLVEDRSLQGVSSLILVGGFGNSSYLKAELERRVAQHNIPIVVPHDADLAVLKGAVMFGLNTKTITSRMMKHTYGVAMEPKFNPSKHKASKKVIRNGTEFCGDVFQEYVKRGISKNVGESITKKFFPRTPNQQSMSFDIFYTDKLQLDKVEYTDSNHFKIAGGLTVLMPNKEGGMNREVQVMFFFGGTEILVTAKDVASRQVAEASVDMLVD